MNGKVSFRYVFKDGSGFTACVSREDVMSIFGADTIRKGDERAQHSYEGNRGYIGEHENRKYYSCFYEISCAEDIQ